MGKTYRRDKRELEDNRGSKKRHKHREQGHGEGGRRKNNNNFGRNRTAEDVFQDFVDQDE